MGDVVTLDVITRLDLPAERIIKGAEDANMEDIVVIGFDGDGEFYFASSKANGAEVVWLLEMAKKKLLDMAD